MWQRHLINYGLFFTGLIAGLYFISFNVVGHSLEFFPGDYIDGRFNIYILEHVYRFFTGKVTDFWNAPFMFPEQNVISYSDNLLGSAPFYCLFRAFGCSRETSFQCWYLLVTILNYSCCYLFLNFIFKNPMAAIGGAMVFTFSLALQSQVGHAQTFPRYAAPLAIWLLVKFIIDFKPIYFFGALFFLAYQLYCGIYLGFLLAVPFILLLLFGALANKNEVTVLLKQKNWLIKILLGGLINLALLLPLLIPYFERAWQTGFYKYENIVTTVPTIGSYFFSWNGSLFWDFLNKTCIDYPAFYDHELFSGGFAISGFLFSLVLLIRWYIFKRGVFFNENKSLHLILLVGVITFILFLRIDKFSLYQFIYKIPGYGSMRALQRIINIELLFFSIGLTAMLTLVLKNKRLITPVLTLFIIVLIVADNYLKPGFIHQRNKAAAQQRVKNLIDKAKPAENNSVLSYEPDTLESAPMDYHLDAMLASQDMGIKTLNGYSATSPELYSGYWLNPNEENRKIWLKHKNMEQLKVLVVK